MVLTCYTNCTMQGYMPLCILPSAKQKCWQNGQTELDVGAAQLPAAVKQKLFRNVIEILHSHTILTFWLRDASTSLTFNNCTLCPYCIYVLCKQ
jgi:hypothetical protein